MKAVVISDLHLGSRHSMAGRFVAFLRSLPPETALVLNGDTVDALGRQMPPEHTQALDAIRDESVKRRVIWILGNHDGKFRLEDAPEIEYAHDWSVPGRLYVSHGAEFLPFRRFLKATVYVLLPLRVRLLGDPILTVRTIKKVRLFFSILNWGMMRKAASHAARNGFPCIVCGHMHMPADTMVNGVRYINTGTWTEWPAHYVLVDDSSVSLCSTT